MNNLLNGLICLVKSFQPIINIDLHLSANSIRIIWYNQSFQEVIDFECFYWSTNEEEIKAIQSAIIYLTECMASDILTNIKNQKVAA